MLDIIKSALWNAQVIASLALLGADVILSIIAAVKDGSFSFRNLGDFVKERVFPLLGYLVVAALTAVIPEWNALAIAVYAGVVVMYSTAIIRAIKDLTGVEIPKVLTEKKDGS